MNKAISCRDLQALMASNELYAVFDVRERGEFNKLQIANASSLPRSQIEFRIAGLVSHRNTPIVVYDEDDNRALLAARTLTDLGYAPVSVLEGGLPAWERAGYPTASGVNVPSKAFGERVYHERGVPEITAEELQRLRESAADLVILDMRTPEEYGRFCIPGGVNVPGGDLIHWAGALREQPEKTVIVNCAGRTRSIIGAAGLRRMGLASARALKNGTMGWVLAGLELERKPERKPRAAPPESRAQAAALALRIAAEEGIPWVSADELGGVLENKSAAVAYLIDVRSETEYEIAHIPGSINVPGGQAVQRTDDFIAVRNGKIIFISNDAARAVMAAYWFRQMGLPDVGVLRGGLDAWRESGGALAAGPDKSEPLGFEQAKRAVQLLSPEAAQSRIQGSTTTILDVGASPDHEAAHVPGAKWIPRGWLEIKLPDYVPDKSRSVVVTCPDGRQSIFAARALGEMGYENVGALAGGVRAWSAAGFQTESGLAGCLTAANDVVLSPSIRGNKEDMQRYLDWELKLKH